jgi:hypothetical protein
LAVPENLNEKYPEDLLLQMLQFYSPSGDEGRIAKFLAEELGCRH